MAKHIPNILSLLNLLSGCIALIFVINGGFAEAAVLVSIALVLDFLDGFTARWLKAYSAIGRELDSLADLVSFGLVPGMIAYKLLAFSGNIPSLEFHGIELAATPAFLITLMSALRLAIFNLDNSQSTNFRGLPTPANAIFIVSLPLLYVYGNETSIASLVMDICRNYWYLMAIVLISSFMLISPIKLLSLKIKPGDMPDNAYRYFLVIFSALAILWLGIAALPLIIIFYLLLSFVWQLHKDLWQRRKT